jgi:3',5'-cyclic AMP phosphodiesterase CpdA
VRPDRRKFLTTAALAAGLAPFVGCGRTLTGPSFGVVADPQYADIPDRGRRSYRASVGRLTEAVADFNRRDLDFCVNLGDAIDRDWGSFDAILAPLANARAPWRHVLGNHDFAVDPSLVAQVPARLGIPSRRAVFDLSGVRFVILDSNAVSVYAHPEGSPVRKAAVAELARLKAAKAPQAFDWNGGFGEEQLRWFDRLAAEAEVAGLRVVVLAHHPVLPARAHVAWDAPAALEIALRRRSVAAWLCGHDHAGAYAERDGVHFITFQGMVETPDRSAYAFVSLHGDRMLIEGRGREPSRELVLRPV